MTIVEHYERFLAETGSEVAAAILAVGAAGQQVPADQRHTLSPPQVAKQLGVDAATVISWIRSRQLKASNVGKGGQRPRFRIQYSDLDAFLKSRQIQPVAKRQRRSKLPAGEIEYF